MISFIIFLCLPSALIIVSAFSFSRPGRQETRERAALTRRQANLNYDGTNAPKVGRVTPCAPSSRTKSSIERKIRKAVHPLKHGME